MFPKLTAFTGLLLLLSTSASGLRADPVLGPAVERNGLRFESWLASPKIAIPSKTIDYNHSEAMMLFSVRVTNLTQTPVRLNPYCATLKIVKPGGEEVPGGMVIAGSVRPPQDPDYLLLQPGQSLVLPCLSHLYWYNNALCLDWPSWYVDHSMSYGGLTTGDYYFTLDFRMPNWPISSRNRRRSTPMTSTPPIVLDDLWTGNASVSSMTFELTRVLLAVDECRAIGYN